MRGVVWCDRRMRTLDVTAAPADMHRTGGRVFTFAQYGDGLPLPDDPVTLVDGAGQLPGRVYCVNYSRKVLYVEPTPELES